MRKPWMVPLTLLVIASLGCSNGTGSNDDGDDDDDGNTTGMTTTAQQACNAQAQAFCAVFQRCYPWYVQYAFGDEATCNARMLIGCVEQYTADGVAYTPAQGLACANAYQTASCEDVFNGVEPAACSSLPRGTLANGTQCGDASQCSSDACRFSSSAVCGTCSAKVTAGGSCANGEVCDDGLTCASNGSCVSPGNAGATCGNNSPCKSSLVCRNGTCSAPLGAGSSCNAQARECDSNGGLFCNPNNSTCQSFAFANAGQPCGLIGGGYTLCSKSGACRIPQGQQMGTCVAAASDGSTCSDTDGPYCLSPAVCVGGTCQLRSNSCF